MGEYTKNNFFYKPHLGARGENEKNKFDAALDYTDAELADLRNKKHNRIHAINSSEDHTSAITPGSLIKADNNGLPAEASTNDILNIIGASSSPQANQIPILNSSGQLSLPFVQTPILVDGQDLMARVFYVDAVNGSDSNSGTSSAPFATIEKAVNSVPIGGRGTIFLKEGQAFDITQTIEVINKVIKFTRWGTTNPKIVSKFYTTVIGSNTFGTNHSFAIVNSGLSFYYVDFEVEQNTTSYPNASGAVGIKSASFYGSMSGVVFRSSNIKSNNLGVARGRDYGFMSVYLYGCSVDNTNAPILHITSGAGCLVNVGSSYETDNYVSGIVRDANGVPRNVISNLVL